MSLLELLDLLGQATWQPIWVPVLAWTVLALPLWALLQRSERLHPLAEYRLSQVLLASLPLGILAAATTDLFAFASPVAPLVDLNAPTTALQSVPESISFPDRSPDGSGTGRSWHWTHAVGAFTIVAASVVVARLGQLALEVVAVLRVDTFSYTPQDATLTEEAKQLAEAHRVARSFHVRASGKATVPLTVGGMIPTIVLPRDLAEQDEDREVALRHELVHIGRYDDVAMFAERALVTLFAFHPLVSALCTQIAGARERACDAAVLDTGSTSPSSYAQLLVAFAEGRRPESPYNALSLSESPSSLPDRLSAMRSSISYRVSTTRSLVPALLLAGIGLPLVVAGCTDLLDSSSGSSVEAVASNIQGNDGVWTPVADARRVANRWVTLLNEGKAQESYELARPMVQTTSSEDWSSWVRERRSQLGEETSRRFMFARPSTPFGPPESPSIMFRYALDYQSGKQCQPGVVVVLTGTSWKIGAYGPSCGDREFPEGSSAARDIRTEHQLPSPAEGLETFRQVWDEELREAIGRGKTVIVEFFVDETGSVSDLQATGRTSSPLPPSLRTAALDAVRSANFDPGRLKGEPVSVQMSVPVMFRPPRSQNSQ